jgi:phosphate uptake regulator
MIDETRKAIRWGRSNTLVISLPRHWAKKLGIEPDTQLRVREAPDGSLLIAPLQMGGSPALREATIRLVEQDELTLATLLENYFVDGHDRLVLESAQRLPERVRNILGRIISQLPGYEILEATDRKIVVKDVTSIRAEDIPELVKMTSRATLESIDTLITAMSTGPDQVEQAARELVAQAKRQQGSYLRLQRELRKALGMPPAGLRLAPAHIFDTVYYVLQLASIHENIQHIADALTRRQPPPNQSKIAVAAMTKGRDNLKGAISAFLQRNQEIAQRVLAEIPLLRQWKRQTETIVDVMPDSVITQIILDRMEEVLSYSRGIAKTALLLKTSAAP